MTAEAAGAAPVPLVSLHTHTDLSLCGRPDMTFEAAVAAAVECGYHTLGFCDHVHVAAVTDRPAHAARLRQYRARRDTAAWPVRVLLGAEFEVSAPGRVVECDGILDLCEYTVVAPNHYQLPWIESVSGSFAAVAARELDHIETACRWPHTDILAHPFAGSLRAPGHEPDGVWQAADRGRVRELLHLALERGIALEIQPKLWCQPERAGRVAELFDQWLDMGGRVAPGSDAHDLAGLRAWAARYGEVVARFGLTPERLWWPEACA
ncbi:MAG: PHP domain-containing protein [Gemmatimonadota bacterium]